MFERTALDTEHMMCISIISCEIATETLDLSRTHTTKVQLLILLLVMVSFKWSQLNVIINK